MIDLGDQEERCVVPQAGVHPGGADEGPDQVPEGDREAGEGKQGWDIYPSICLSIIISACLSVYLYIFLSFCLIDNLSIYLHPCYPSYILRGRDVDLNLH